MKFIIALSILVFLSAPPNTNGGDLSEDLSLKAELVQHEEKAINGDMVATHWVGAYYYEGHGVKPDYKKAYSYLSLSAKAGVSGSMIYLGYLFSRGLGVERNCKEAELWFEASSPEPIHQEWRNELSECNKKERDHKGLLDGDLGDPGHP